MLINDILNVNVNVNPVPLIEINEDNSPRATETRREIRNKTNLEVRIKIEQKPEYKEVVNSSSLSRIKCNFRDVL